MLFIVVITKRYYSINYDDCVLYYVESLFGLHLTWVGWRPR